MREIEPTLTAELKAHVGKRKGVAAADAFDVATYDELVRLIARLSYLNKDHLLFFRGQSADYLSKSGSSTLYPSIYRGDPLPRWEVKHRFNVLEQSGNLLAQQFAAAGIDGARDVLRRPYVRWSILQHYEVCATPLLDLTHSLWVAASFATLEGNDHGIVYVVGLPQLSNRISVNSEHDLVTVRLLSICPPEAVRPYFQEGYLSGTHDVSTDYDTKTELDFKNRLIAKVRIPTTGFWTGSLRPAARKDLYPHADKVHSLCSEIRVQAEQEVLPHAVGSFLRLWTDVEEILLGAARQRTDRILSVAPALQALRDVAPFAEIVPELDRLRALRNNLVHRPRSVASSDLEKATVDIRKVLKRLRAAS